MTNPLPLLPDPSTMPLLPKNKKLRILAIDGGALRGIVPAQILSYFDGSIANKQVNDITIPSVAPSVSGAFDLIVGTSAGGLVTAGLTVPPQNSTSLKTALEVVNLFTTKANTIFPLTDDSELIYLSKAMFDNAGLLQAIGGAWGVPAWLQSQTAGSLNTKFPPQTLYDAATSVMITSFNNSIVQTGDVTANQIDGATPWGPVFLNNGTTAQNGSKLSVMQACLMTSAFPLLLPPVPYDLNFLDYSNGSNANSVTKGNYFLDGGIWAGNPAFAAYSWATSNGFEVELLLSLGCGSYTETLTDEESVANYATAAQYGSGVVWAGTKTLSGKPGWLVTARDQVQTKTAPYLSSIADESLLLSILGAGGASVTQSYLNNTISNAGGVYIRIDPTLSLTDVKGNVGPFPPYCSDASVLEGWQTDASNALAPNGALLADWSTLVEFYQPTSA